MTFVLPTFNVTWSAWRGAGGFPVSGPPDSMGMGNLAWGKRVQAASTGGTSTPGILVGTMTLLVPWDADIRGPGRTAPQGDVVECPQGSGRFYYCFHADFIGGGFPNSHKGCMLEDVDISTYPDVPAALGPP